MLKYILIFVFIVLFVMFPFFRCVVLNLPLIVKDGSVDLFTYFKYKMWKNIPEGATVGKIRIYTGLFGKGKTLSATMQVNDIYKRYNNLTVWNNYKKEFVNQRVLVLSNVDLSIPFIRLESLGQITEYAHKFYDYDDENHCYTAIICLIDELSVQLNSREFKTNIDPLFLNTLLTCRKYHIGIIGTAQRFNQVDALFRQVTTDVVECNKIWRLQGQKIYDAYELENCINPELVKPQGAICRYISNKAFASYNTHAMVANLEKKQLKGDMLTEEEILNLISPNMIGADTVVSYSRKSGKRKVHAKKRG